MNREFIVSEIRRTATANNSVPLGREAFRTATGIKASDWLGRYWSRWGDAVAEAGFMPNKMQEALKSEDLIAALVGLIRELGAFPTHAQVRMKSTSDATFPSHTTFDRFGSKTGRIEAVIRYCESHAGLADVLKICTPLLGVSAVTANTESDAEVLGFVYLLRSGRFYKIGRSNAVGRRERELAIQLPEKAVTVHVINTDDPSGIEAYWHTRFAEKRQNGEWFALSPAEVKAFRRRKFM